MSVVGTRTRPGKRGAPASVWAMTVRTGNLAHPGPAGSFTNVVWSSIARSSSGFSLLSGELRVPVPGFYKCSTAFRIIGVGGLTDLDFDWFTDGTPDLPQITSDVPGAGQSKLYSRSAIFEIGQSITVRWREVGATGTSFAVNSTMSVQLLQKS